MELVAQHFSRGLVAGVLAQRLVEQSVGERELLFAGCALGERENRSTLCLPKFGETPTPFGVAVRRLLAVTRFVRPLMRFLHPLTRFLRPITQQWHDQG